MKNLEAKFIVLVVALVAIGYGVFAFTVKDKGIPGVTPQSVQCEEHNLPESACDTKGKK